MQSNEKSSSVDLIPIGRPLESARLDLHSVKVQMFLGVSLIFLACFASYGNIMQTGFLLDDFLHLDYVFRALSGDSRDLLHNFYGNWAGSDIMQSYRPLVSLSLFLDALFYGANAVGYHITNILLLFGCSTLVSLITLEISGLSGNRLGAAAATWAGLLFAIYPLHAESVVWITGRVDQLCVLFFLGSIFSYLRFRIIRERFYFWSALLCFLGALLSKEMAVVLPIVILLAELCLWSPLNFKPVHGHTTWKNRLGYVMPFWALLGMFMTMRLGILGTAIGGYTGVSLWDSWRNLLDKFTILKLLVPANEEVFLAGWVKPELFVCYGVAAALLLGRLLSRKTMPGPFMWLLLWMAVGILPAFQIWHVYPNLVGSRLFFLSSAPFCMLIALAALPAIDLLAKPFLRLFSGIGLVVLLGIYLSWSLMLSANLKPWQTAGQQMTTLRAQVESLGKQTPIGKRVLLLDLPSDYSGAGMLTRPQYLNFLAMPPLASQPLAEKFVTVESPVSGDHAFIWPGQFQEILNHPNLAGVWRFIPSAGKFLSWSKPLANAEVSERGRPARTDYVLLITEVDPAAITLDPPNATTLDANSWSVRSAVIPTVEKKDDFWMVSAGSGLTLWLPVASIDPLKASVATINMVAPASAAGKIQIVWRNASAVVQQATVQEIAGQYLVWLGRYRSWVLNGAVTQIGIRFEPGDYMVKLKGLKISVADSIIPKLTLAAAIRDPHDLWLYPVKQKNLLFHYNALEIPGARAVKLLVGPKNYTFDARNEGEICATASGAALQALLVEVMCPDLTGNVSLPEAIYKAPGLHQARLVVVDHNGKQIGLPSEPLTFVISGTSGN